MVAADRQRRLVVPALLLLTLLSGVVDAVSLLGLGQVFVANMTGNLVLVGLTFARAPESSPAGPLTALAGFVAGSLLVRAVAPRHVNHRALVGMCALLEAALFVVAVLTWSYDGGHEPVLLPIALCAVALGAQNASVRRLGVAGLTTTVMTSTLTGLVAGRAEERTASSTGRQALSVLTLVAGAALGAAVVRLAGPRWALTMVAVLAVAVAFTLLVPDWPSAGRGPAE